MKEQPAAAPAPPTGPAAAAFLAAGAGTLALGLVTALCEASPAAGAALDWYPPAGPLTGKVGVAVLAWGLGWAGLHAAWRRKSVRLVPAVLVAVILIALGLVATFPPVFQLLGP